MLFIDLCGCFVCDSPFKILVMKTCTDVALPNQLSVNVANDIPYIVLLTHVH